MYMFSEMSKITLLFPPLSVVHIVATVAVGDVARTALTANIRNDKANAREKILLLMTDPTIHKSS
jgi:hypothetical protein